MIDVDPHDVVATRHTADGRFVIFTSTDVPPRWLLRFWGVVIDTGGDGQGTLVRFEPRTAPEGWTVRQLIQVVQARMEAEHQRSRDGGALAVLQELRRASGFRPGVMPEPALLPAPPAAPVVTFEAGTLPSPYTWTVARCGELILPLCPDPESRDEGVTPEQLLILLDQMLIEWAAISPHRWRIHEARHAVKDALAAEVRRVRTARSEVPQARPSD